MEMFRSDTMKLDKTFHDWDFAPDAEIPLTYAEKARLLHQ